MPDPSTSPQAILDLGILRRQLEQVIRQVASENRRVEIGDGRTGDTCVLISKSELDSLERALQILADTDGVRDLSEALAHLCAGLPPVAASAQ